MKMLMMAEKMHKLHVIRCYVMGSNPISRIYSPHDCMSCGLFVTLSLTGTLSYGILSLASELSVSTRSVTGVTDVSS